jgi:hypothetical protein
MSHLQYMQHVLEVPAAPLAQVPLPRAPQCAVPTLAYVRGRPSEAAGASYAQVRGRRASADDITVVYVCFVVPCGHHVLQEHELLCVGK